MIIIIITPKKSKYKNKQAIHFDIIDRQKM